MNLNSVAVFTRIPNLLKELRAVLPNLTFHEVKSDEDVNLKKYKILICDFDKLGKHVYDLPETKWVQGTWAGVNMLLPYIKPNQPPQVLVTRFSGPHFGQMMIEYVITYITSHERDLFTVYKNQLEKKWDATGRIADYRIISELKIGILGVGQLGTAVGQALTCMGAHVMGLGRTPITERSEEKSCFKEYFTKDYLPQLLSRSDYVINTLPHTSETQGLLNGDILKNCKDKSTVFINIGRGGVIAENDLVNALEQNWISAAILDVFEKEPLPQSSRLWSMDKVIVTPHVSAVSYGRHIAQQFKENYQLYIEQKTIPTTVDFSKQY